MNPETKQTCCSCKCKCGWIIGLVVALAVAGAAAYYFFFAPRIPSLSDTASLLTLSEIAAPQNTEFFYALQSNPDSKLFKLYKNALQNPEANPLFTKVQATLKDKYDMTLDPKVIATLDPKGFSLIAWSLDEKKSIWESLANDTTNTTDKNLPFGAAVLLNLGPRAQVVEMIGKFLPATQNQEKVLQGSSTVDGREIYFAGPKDDPSVKIFWAYWTDLLVVATRETDLTQTLQRLRANKNDLSKNLLYQKAKKLAGTSYEAFVFADLHGLSQMKKVQDPTQDPLLKQFISSVELAFLLAKTQGNNLITDARIVWNKETAGPLGQALSAVDQKMDYQFAAAAPETTNFVSALNIKSLWFMATKIMALYPSQAGTQEMIAQRLKPLGLDLNKDILENITGELSFLITWPTTQKLPNSKDSVTEVMQSVSAFTENMGLMLGVQNAPAFQTVLQKALGPFLLQAKVETYEGQSITNANSFAFSFVDQALLLGTTVDSIKKTIDAIKTKRVLSEKPALKKLSSSINTQSSFAQFYVDYPAYMDFVMNAAATSQNEQATAEARPDAAQDELKKYLETVKQLYGDALMSVSVQQDGLQMRAAMELK